MASRPSISDKTIERVEKWIEENPEKGITETNKAIEYLVDQALSHRDNYDIQQIRKEINELKEQLE